MLLATIGPFVDSSQFLVDLASALHRFFLLDAPICVLQGLSVTLFPEVMLKSNKFVFKFCILLNHVEFT